MQTFTFNGVNHAYLDRGARGDSVTFFLHGLLTSSEVWRAQIEALASSHRVVALDWPGHGASSIISQRVRIQDLADTVVALLDRLAIRRTTLVGLSLGGIVAMATALQYPARVDALVLVSTPHAPETELQRRRHFETLDAASRIGRTPILKGIALRLFGATTRRSRPELVTRWLECASSIDFGSLRMLSEAAVGRSRAPSLGAGAPRALIVRGAEDALLAQSDCGELAKALGGAPIVTIPHSGHLVPMEAPEAFTERLVTFLE